MITALDFSAKDIAGAPTSSEEAAEGPALAKPAPRIYYVNPLLGGALTGLAPAARPCRPSRLRLPSDSPPVRDRAVPGICSFRPTSRGCIRRWPGAAMQRRVCTGSRANAVSVTSGSCWTLCRTGSLPARWPPGSGPTCSPGPRTWTPSIRGMGMAAPRPPARVSSSRNSGSGGPTRPGIGWRRELPVFASSGSGTCLPPRSVARWRACAGTLPKACCSAGLQACRSITCRNSRASGSISCSRPCLGGISAPIGSGQRRTRSAA